MKGKPIEATKQALCTALSKFDSQDLFNIIAFNSEKNLFSSSLELATKNTIENATQWIGTNFIAGGGTNILDPLTQAMEMFSCAQQQIPIVFLITDGAVEDERHIYDVLKSHLMQNQMISPRLYTFGIGLFCNHYFLRMLAVASRGHYNAAYDVDSIEIRMEQLFSRASSVILANIAFENLDGLEEFEVRM
ncbi:von Willebrand factor A domain-containing protein DDB_G0292028-like [Capsicum annuum]|uniref:von Willebrand factor A domain-containing protein DDB_G0292028-like n=1 Tax=Capsicum annuum TaxID=4072 RepID=UPI001FB1229D|nr:von Willebrand factor A domain-containing protein DDB_G0292028-like [Capsicum annuum]